MTEWVTQWVGTWGGPTDGTTDCSPFWKTFRDTYVASHLGETARIQFPGGNTYTFYTDPDTPGIPIGLARLFTGGLIVEAIGSGYAKISGYLSLGCGLFIDGYGTANTCPIQTVAAGATSVTAITPSKTALFVADGRWAVVTGIDLQAAGQPPNPYFFDYCIPTSTSTSSGVVTLTNPLKYTYLSTWPILALGTASGEYYQGGPGTMYPLVSTWHTNVEYINCDIAGNIPGDGGVQAVSCELRRGVFTNCKFTNRDGLNISQAFMIWFRNCDLTGPLNWEIDKMVNTCVFDNCTISGQATAQSVTMERIIFGNRTTINNLNKTGKELVLCADSTITTLTLGGGFGPPNKFYWAGTVTGFSSTWNTYYKGIPEIGINNVSTITAGVITIAKNIEAQRWPVPGHTYWLVESAGARWRVPFRVTAVASSTSDETGNILVTTDLGLTGWPSWGSDIWIGFHPCPELYRYNYAHDWTWPQGQPMDSYLVEYFSTVADPSNPAHPIINLGTTTGGNYAYTLFMVGKITSIHINVTAAYGSALVWKWPSQPGNYPYTRPNFALVSTYAPHIDLNTTGDRVLVGGATATTFGADSGLDFPSNEDVWMAGSGGAATDADLTGTSSPLAMTVTYTINQNVVPQSVTITAFECAQLADVFNAMPELYIYYPSCSVGNLSLMGQACL